MSNTQFDEREPLLSTVLVQPGGAGGQSFPSQALTTPSRIDQMLGANSDITDHTFTVTYNPPIAGPTELGSVVIPAGAGHAGAPMIDLLTKLGIGADQGILVLVGDQIAVTAEVSVTTVGLLSCYIRGGSL